MKGIKKAAALVLAAAVVLCPAEYTFSAEHEGAAETVMEAETETETEAESAPAGETSDTVEEILEDGAVSAETLSELPEAEAEKLPEDLPVVGSDGIQHESVGYLKVSEARELTEEGNEHYVELCNTAAEAVSEGPEGTESVLSLDEEGDAVLRTSAPIEQFLAADSAKDDTDRKSFFYGKLVTPLQRRVFNASLKNAKKAKNSFGITIGSTEYSWSGVCNGINAAMNTDITSYEWINMGRGKLKTKCRYSDGSVKMTVSMTKSKFYNKTLEKKAKKKVKALVAEAKAYADEHYPNDPDYGIVEYLDKWLCANNEYKIQGTDAATYGTKKVYYYCHSGYGCLLKGYGVCESYSRALKRLLDQAGIPNYSVVGNASGSHAWNEVQMSDGKWYMVDSTWNDRGKGSSKKYFLVGNDPGRKAHGLYFSSGRTVIYPAMSKEAYQAAA